MLKIIRNSFDVLLLMLVTIGFTGIIAARWYATQIIHLPLPPLETVLYFIPSLAFYAGILLWFLVLTTPYFRKSSIWRWLVFLYLLLIIAIDAMSSVFIRGAGDWFNLYILYYMQTQFNSLTLNYEKFQLWFILLIPVVIAGSLIISFLIATLKKNKQRLQLTIASILLLLFSLISFTPNTPKSLTLSALSYSLLTLESRPKADDFNKLPALEVSSILHGEISNKPNIVLIVMESTRKSAISYYNPSLKRKTTFFDELAKESLVFDNMYTIMPFTFKAMVNMNCGFTSYIHMQFFESTYGLPDKCLPQWLQTHGYHTMFMQSSSVSYGNINTLTDRLGFKESFSSEHFDKENFKQSFLDSSEDSIMLNPNRKWLQQIQSPFYAMYLTYSPHWPYNFYDRDNYVQYIEQDDGFIFNFKKEFNNYLNAVHTQDKFMQQLIEQYQDAGLYDNTIFVFIADHGQGFAENMKRHYQHGNNLYQEGLTIPFMIHAPALIKQAEHRSDLLQQTDLPAIIKNLLQGKDALENVHNNQVFSVCWYWRWCVSRTDAKYKYIHNFDDSPDELYDLIHDPQELHNISNAHPNLIKTYKQETLNWYYQQLATYKKLYQSEDPEFYIRGFIPEPKGVTLRGLTE